MSKKNQDKKNVVAEKSESTDFSKCSLEQLYTALGTGKLSPPDKSRVLEQIAIKQSDSDRRVMQTAVMSVEEKTKNRINELKMNFHGILGNFVKDHKEELCKAKLLLAKTAAGDEKGSWSAFSITEPVKLGSDAMSFQIVCQVSNMRITKQLYKKMKFDAQQALLAAQRQAAINAAWENPE